MEGTTPPQQPQAPVLTQADIDRIKAETVNEITGGKFGGDIEKAKEGYWNLTNYASQAMNALKALDSRDNPADIANARPATPAGVSPWDDLSKDYYGDTSVLRRAVQAEAQAIIADAFKPIQQSAQARQNITRSLPDYVNKEADVISFLEQNPDLYRMVYETQVSGNPEAAMRLAYGEFYRAQTANQSVPPKMDAPLTNVGGSPPNGPPPGQPNGGTNWVDEIKRAHMTGDPRAVYTKLFANYDPQLPPHMQG